MRKYIIGILIGAVLTFTSQAFAATLLGSTVDAVIQVEVDGQIMGQAPVIDGVSYLPVRQFGNKAGYNVTFGEGKATLTSEEVDTVGLQEAPVAEATTTTIMSDYDAEALKSSEEQIVISENKIVEYTEKIKLLEADLIKAENKVKEKTGAFDKPLSEAELSMIKQTIEGTNQLLQAAKGNILSQRAYIAKIKAKYDGVE